MYDEIASYWRSLVDVMQSLSSDTVAQVADMLFSCYRRGSTVFVLGNGGSAATASHFACDLAKGTRAPGLPAFRVIPLSDNVPLMTAWANDTSYDRIFAEQLSALVRPDDLVIVISASGNSPNVLAAAGVAQEAGALVIALTGQSGGQLYTMADLSILVPSTSIEQVEDAHLAIAHSLCVALRQRLFAESALLEVEQSVFHSLMAETAIGELNI